LCGRWTPSAIIVTKTAATILANAAVIGQLQLPSLLIRQILQITDNHDILLNVRGKLNISEISNPTTPNTMLHAL
jgi:predicted aconitase with swiveling domain